MIGDCTGCRSGQAKYPEIWPPPLLEIPDGGIASAPATIPTSRTGFAEMINRALEKSSQVGRVNGLFRHRQACLELHLLATLNPHEFYSAAAPTPGPGLPRSPSGRREH